jgi:hypothetical protein
MAKTLASLCGRNPTARHKVIALWPANAAAVGFILQDMSASTQRNGIGNLLGDVVDWRVLARISNGSIAGQRQSHQVVTSVEATAVEERP